MYLAKNNSLLKNNVAYVSMATKYPIIKIFICANYEDIGHQLLPDTTFRLYYQDVHDVVHYHKWFDDSLSFLSVYVQWVDLNNLRDGFI